MIMYRQWLWSSESLRTNAKDEVSYISLYYNVASRIDHVIVVLIVLAGVVRDVLG